MPERYFLSPNAATGILRRADQMGRNLFPPFRSALEILSGASSRNSLTVSTPKVHVTQARTGRATTSRTRKAKSEG